MNHKEKITIMDTWDNEKIKNKNALIVLQILFEKQEYRYLSIDEIIDILEEKNRDINQIDSDTKTLSQLIEIALDLLNQWELIELLIQGGTKVVGARLRNNPSIERIFYMKTMECPNLKEIIYSNAELEELKTRYESMHHPHGALVLLNYFMKNYSEPIVDKKYPVIDTYQIKQYQKDYDHGKSLDLLNQWELIELLIQGGTKVVGARLRNNPSIERRLYRVVGKFPNLKEIIYSNAEFARLQFEIQAIRPQNPPKRNKSNVETLDETLDHSIMRLYALIIAKTTKLNDRNFLVSIWKNRTDLEDDAIENKLIIKGRKIEKKDRGKNPLNDPLNQLERIFLIERREMEGRVQYRIPLEYYEGKSNAIRLLRVWRFIYPTIESKFSSLIRSARLTLSKYPEVLIIEMTHVDSQYVLVIKVEDEVFSAIDNPHHAFLVYPICSTNHLVFGRYSGGDVDKWFDVGNNRIGIILPGSEIGISKNQGEIRMDDKGNITLINLKPEARDIVIEIPNHIAKKYNCSTTVVLNSNLTHQTVKNGYKIKIPNLKDVQMEIMSIDRYNNKEFLKNNGNISDAHIHVVVTPDEYLIEDIPKSESADTKI